VEEWLADWPLIYRDEATVAALFPAGMSPQAARSGNGALVYGWARPRL
jgi:hypothetical protein